MNRGVTRRAGNDLSGALADYGAAIDLMKGLRTRLGAEWPPAWGNDLAAAYMNRGVTRRAGNDLSGALADYGAAIDLREGLRTHLGAEWPPAWGNALAAAYLNRGMTQEAGQDPEAALANWGLGRDLFTATLNRGYWPAGRGLLQCEAMALVLHTGRADWPRAAECLVEFLTHFGELEEGWPESGLSGDPPWRDVAGWCFGQLAALDPDQRAALLAALGDDVGQVKRLLHW
jgi:tetratricopeptide (TPR) repeat protein